MTRVILTKEEIASCNIIHENYKYLVRDSGGTLWGCDTPPRKSLIDDEWVFTRNMDYGLIEEEHCITNPDLFEEVRSTDKTPTRLFIKPGEIHLRDKFLILEDLKRSCSIPTDAEWQDNSIVKYYLTVDTTSIKIQSTFTERSQGTIYSTERQGLVDFIARYGDGEIIKLMF